MSQADQERAAFEAKIHEYVGLKEGPPYTCPDTVNEPMIRHWCEVMGDENPVYTDPAKAKESVHEGIVAPPTMMQTWDMRGYPMHDPSLLDNKQRELHRVFDEAGYTGVVATNTEQEFERYLAPGDTVTSETTIESISEQKATALGIGYFIVTRTIFTDQDGEQIGWLTFRVLKFKPAQQPAAEADAAAAPSKPRRIRSPEGHDNAWWWQGFRDGKLLIQQCSDCGALRHPCRPMCGKCQSTNWEAIVASGRGTVHSYTIMHHPMVPGYDFPLPIGLIDLEEGTRIVANIKGCELDDIHIGMKVEGIVEPASEDDDLMLPFFYAVK
ncbi:MAG: bifunctional MaoC family dehydratase N-terminal/OB-fold nucleic acid binding domain-containing protein [Myxococcota bacterium]|nr:bifunctional MaoC family dehydratase N-terminal/OB-fold nucleic acid binding domain-containing protein [Myxococcota bacterium]